VGIKHVVYFDEISKTRCDDAEASISTFKDYMQTSVFSRLGQEIRASASIVLGGAQRGRTKGTSYFFLPCHAQLGALPADSVGIAVREVRSLRRVLARRPPPQLAAVASEL
jgi:predicted ATP-dependent Lon-type protease